MRLKRRRGTAPFGVALLAGVLVLSISCGKSDDDDSNGTAGTSARGGSAGANGGKGGGSGAAFGGAGQAGSVGGRTGGASGASAGGTGGSSGASAGTAGSDAGRGGSAGSNAGSGGTSNPQGGSAGDGGSSAGAPGGSSGAASGGEGGARTGVEFNACTSDGAITRIDVQRIDWDASTCTIVTVQQGTGACQPLNLVSNGWCINVARATGTTSCAGDATTATAATGTFTVTVGDPLVVDLDITLEFPDSAPVPESLDIELSSCSADCSGSECRD